MQKKAEETVLFLSCEKGISIGLEQGLERGAYQTKLETARSMLLDGFSPEMICKYTSLPIETIQQLIG